MGRPFTPDMIPEPDSPAAYSVTEVNNLAKRALERNFNSIYVVGEVTNFTPHSSGHLYFTLKDEQSQLDAVMWRDAAARVAIELEPGMEVLAFGDLTLYTRRGRYQLSVRSLEPRGMGALEIAFRQLRERLEKEGLFDEEHKKPLPFIPGKIVLVTSRSGAAVRDMLKSIFDRFPGANVSVFPVSVQGTGAAGEIAAAIDALNFDGSFDVIVIGRGGGSLEDLWAFNEEVVARAVHRSDIPVVSAVGHERDVSISDLVADRRAMTPTEVGLIVVPDQRELLQRLDELRDSLVVSLTRIYSAAADRLAYAWRHPVFARPQAIIPPLANRLDAARARIDHQAGLVLTAVRERLKRALVSLDSLSPLAVLARGYSITRDKSGNILTHPGCLVVGQSIETILSRGRIISRVDVWGHSGGGAGCLRNPRPNLSKTPSIGSKAYLSALKAGRCRWRRRSSSMKKA